MISGNRTPFSACTSQEREAQWTFDTASYGIGQLATETNDLSTRTLSYDSLSRVIQTQNTLDGKTTTDQWTFDNVGRPFRHFFATDGAPSTGERTVYRPEGYHPRSPISDLRL
jgi:YD repeat-containing protein